MLIILVVVLFAVIDGYLVPLVAYLHYYKKIGLQNVFVQHHFFVIYNTPHLLSRILPSQPYVGGIFGFFLVGAIYQQISLRKTWKNQSDEHGIRGSARWATKREMLEWWH